MRLSTIGWLFFAICISANNAQAHEELTLFNQVYVQAQVERDIANDEMQTLLVSEHQGKNASDLSARVNQDIKWALSKVKLYKDIEVSTRAYQTYPIYKDSDVVGWRVGLG